MFRVRLTFAVASTREHLVLYTAPAGDTHHAVDAAEMAQTLTGGGVREAVLQRSEYDTRTRWTTWHDEGDVLL